MKITSNPKPKFYLLNECVNKILKYLLQYRMNFYITRTLNQNSNFSRVIFLTYILKYPIKYGSENWSLHRSDKRKVEAAEMRVLRSAAGYTLLDNNKKSNDLREQLAIFNINDTLT